MRRNLGLLMVAGLFAVVGAALTLAQTPPPTTSTGPKVNPAAVQKMAGAPVPANAKKAKSAGGTATKVSTANGAADDDSTWVAQVDFDGDGDVEDVSFVWDDEDKVLYAYADGAYLCANGGVATGEMLVAAYAAGNTGKRPAGSGFWLADLDAGECAAHDDALWGCKFDASGAPTTCGSATVDEKTDDLVVVTASR